MIPFLKKNKDGKKPPKSTVPRTAQESIPFQRMFEDGTCRVRPGYYTRTIQYQDINYQLAQQEDKTAIFEEWCSFLNFFDSSIHFELSFVNTATDSADFEKSIRIPYQKDGFDDVRAEYSQMLRQQLSKGNNGLTKTKFLTYGIEGESMAQVKPRLEHIQNDLMNNFHRLGVLAKPLDGMGSFETITAQIGAILGTDVIDIRKKGVLIFCADNGIVEEGVSQTGQEVTLAVAKSMARKGSSVCRMAQSIGAETIPVDIGINSEESIPGVWNRKVCSGTRNFLKEPAMTEEETVRAIATGTRLVRECKEKGYGILATGEMGIGNTTTSSAVTAALLQCGAEEVTGRGAGLTDQGLARKQQVVRTALETYDLWHADAFTVLQTVGGLDIAGLTGMCIGGALWHVPIVLDGVISMAAALVAERLFPGVREYLIPSHLGKEPAAVKLADALQLSPVIHAGMALGEGTGAVMMLTLLDMAMSIYGQSATFSEIKVEQYRR